MAEVAENKIEETSEPAAKKPKIDAEGDSPIKPTESETKEESPNKNGSAGDVAAETEDAPKESSKPEDKENSVAAGNDEPPSQLESKIIQQIEHYFGDSNLSRDKFLNEQVGKDDSWVPLSVLLTFKRLAALSTDIAVIVAALAKSDEGLIEIHEDKTKIRRHPERPLPEQNEETRKECIGRSAYVKGFPLDAQMSELIEYFNDHDKVLNICMRKYLDKPTKQYKFKGSVFATFAKKEQCENFVKKEKILYKEAELIKMWQSDYYESKKLERQNEKQKNKKADDKFSIDLPKGALMHLEGIGKQVTREQIKESFTEHGGEVAFIDYNKGDETGHVRLTTENTAKPFVEKLEDSKMKIDGNEVTLRVIEGDEETEFLKKAVESMRNRRTRKFGGGRHQNNRSENRKRHASPSGGDPKNKKAALE